MKRPTPWAQVAHVLRSDALGGAVARYAPDGDRPAQALSLEETMRRAPARCTAESPEQQRADVRNGYDLGLAQRLGYAGQGPLHNGPIVACVRAARYGMSCGCRLCAR